MTLQLTSFLLHLLEYQHNKAIYIDGLSSVWMDEWISETHTVLSFSVDSQEGSL